MLIDAGNEEDFNKIDKYLKKLGITKLDIVVGTHAHEDHIGSLDYIIENLDVSKIYFSKHIANTKTFRDFALSVESKELKLTAPKAGDEFTLGDVKFKVLAPSRASYDSINNYSIVLKAVYGKSSYIFTGDAETLSENEMLANFPEDLKNIDVLKVAHHGSKSSTSADFLNSINPKYAVISVGKDNDYGHPTKSVINRLTKKEINIHRTDECGDIVSSADGEGNISFKCEFGR